MPSAAWRSEIRVRVSHGQRANRTAQRVIELHRRAIFDGFGNRVLVEIPCVVFLAEHFERAFAVREAVNWRAGEADISCVGQRAHQIVAQVAARRAVRFVHQHDDARARVDFRGNVVELVNRRNDETAIIGRENLAQIVLAVCDLDSCDAVTLDVLEELLFEFVAVNQHQHHRLFVSALRSRKSFDATVIIVNVLPLPCVCQINPRRLVGSYTRSSTFARHGSDAGGE